MRERDNVMTLATATALRMYQREWDQRSRYGETDFIRVGRESVDMTKIPLGQIVTEIGPVCAVKWLPRGVFL